MSISNYAELQTAVANWSHRADLTSVIPDFISLAEARINRDLRIRAMEDSTTGALSADTLALPTGHIGTKALTITYGSCYREVEYVPPNQILIKKGSTGNTAPPTVYTIIGDNIQFAESGSGDYTHVFYKKFDALSSGVNWLITNAPDVYLYASLIELATYTKNNQDVEKWSTLYSEAIKNLTKSDYRDRYGPSLRVVAA